jgi:DNA end-binding protein Ku
VGAKAAGLKDSELKMARQLIDDMASGWSADQFRDSFRDEIMKMVEAKAKAGETETVAPVEDDPSTQRGADVIDLTELLKRSLQGGKAAAPASKTAARKTPAKPAGKKAAPARSTTRRAA